MGQVPMSALIFGAATQNARPGPLLGRVDHTERAQDLASAIRDSAANGSMRWTALGALASWP